MDRRHAVKFLCLAPVFFPACTALKRSTGETEQTSEAVVYRGYRSSGHVKASVSQIMEMWHREADVMRWNVFKSVEFQPGTGDLREPGAKARARLRVGGLDWNILFTNIRNADLGGGSREAWFAGVYPTVHVQKWRLEPDGDGTKVSFYFYGEPPTTWGGTDIYWTEIIDYFIEFFDHAFGNLQAEFDPSFDLDGYLAEGTHGEVFDALFQRFTANSLVLARQAEAFDYLRDQAGFTGLIGRSGGSRECEGEPGRMHCPFEVEIGGRNIKFDAYPVKERGGRKLTYLMAWSDYVASVELLVEPALGLRSALVTARYTIELPNPSSDLALDLTLHLADMPEKMKREMELMKDSLT